MSESGQPIGSSDEPTPYCPACKHELTPATDVLYQGISFGAKYSIIYCGWCGVVLGGGPSSEMHFLGTKTRRG